MQITRQFERRGPLWLPRYDPVFPRPDPRRRPLERFERWQRRCGRDSPGAVSWSHVNGIASEAYASSGSTTLSLGFTPSAGSLLVAACGVNNTGSTLSITDNSSGPSDSWTALCSQTGWGSSGTTYSFRAWATNVTAGTAPTTVTFSFGSSAESFYMVVDNYTGGPNPFVQDGNAAFGGTSGSYTNSASASYTTGSVAGDLVWSAGLNAIGLSSAPTVASPFTIRSQQSSGYYAYSSDDGVPSGVAASTQQTATYSLSGNVWWIVCIVGFQASAAAFEPDEDYWAWRPPGAADPTVTVWG